MKVISIGDRLIGDDKPCFVVAEIGINHNGDLQIAKDSMAAAASAGADAVKFQNYRTEDFISDRNLTHEYVSQGVKVVESQFDMFKRCELTAADLAELKAHADKLRINFHSTPTGKDGVADLLASGVRVLKNGSDYLTDWRLIKHMGNTGLPVVLSTGMSTRQEIAEAVKVFRETGNEQLILLHCTSSYPTPVDDVHLLKMQSLRQEFDALVGFSDHTEGNIAAIGAVALGACWIEKHFTLDKTLPGPDHRFSADPQEFKELVNSVRVLQRSLGVGVLGPTTAEEAGRNQYRLSCVTARALPSGHLLQEDDIAFRRPGTGIPPANIFELLGKRVKGDLPENKLVSELDLV